MRTLTIASESGKGRAFNAHVLAFARADALWEGGRGDVLRPVFLQVACSDQEAKPFLANLQSGCKAKMLGNGCLAKGDPVEILKSGGYIFRSQRFAAGTVITAHLPKLLVFDPGLVEPRGASFVVLPPRARLEQESARLPGAMMLRHAEAFGEQMGWDVRVGETLRVVFPALAALFCGALVRRIDLPILPDMRFQARLFVAMLHHGCASVSAHQHLNRGCAFGEHPRLGFYEWGTDRVKLAPGVAFMAKHDEIALVVAEQTKIFNKARR
ncbi:MAG: hypothetical protein ACTHU0_21500 [Kofleriaceae bacterium]